MRKRRFYLIYYKERDTITMKTKTIIYILPRLLCACAQAQIPDTAVTTEVSAVSSDTASETAETSETDTSAEETTTAEETEAPAKVASGEETVAAETVVAEDAEPVYPDKIAKGTYEHIEVRSSSSMFKIADCTLEVGDTMTARLFFDGSAYGKLYMGTAEEAASDEENALVCTETDGGYYFDIPVEALDKGISVAAFSNKKEKWYDRQIAFISSSMPSGAVEIKTVTAEDMGLSDGEYNAEVTLTGGSGKASVESPARITVSDGKVTAHIVWSSKNYDYMIVGEEKYLPVEGEENSAFDIPVDSFDVSLPVRADTTAMSVPYEIEYTLFFDSSTVTEA